MPWVHYVLSLILFMHNTKGRKQTSNWQKYNNCSEFCPQCHNSLWRESLTDRNISKDIMLSSFVSFIRTLSTWELTADFSFFVLQYFLSIFLNTTICKKPSSKSHGYLKRVFSWQDHLQGIFWNMLLNKTAAIVSKLFVFEMRLTNWDPNSLFHLQVWFISIPLLCLEENIISEDWLMDVLGSKFQGKHQFKIFAGSKG